MPSRRARGAASRRSVGDVGGNRIGSVRGWGGCVSAPRCQLGFRFGAGEGVKFRHAGRGPRPRGVAGWREEDRNGGAAPGRLSTPPSRVNLTCPDDRRPRRAAHVFRARTRGRNGEDPRQLGRLDADPSVGHGDRAVAVRLGADVDPDRAAARRELDPVADEVRDHLPDPHGIVADLDRLLRPGHRQVHALAAGRRRGLLDACSTTTAGPRPEVEEHEAGSSLESSRRFWASQSRRSSWARLVSRNSARADGSSAAPSVMSSLNVRSARSGSRSCETSSRNSRLRSRSRG